MSGPLHSRSSVSLIIGSFLSSTASGFSSGPAPELTTLSFSLVCAAAAIRMAVFGERTPHGYHTQYFTCTQTRTCTHSRSQTHIQTHTLTQRALLSRAGKETVPNKRRLLARTCRGTFSATTPSGLHSWSLLRGCVFEPAAVACSGPLHSVAPLPAAATAAAPAAAPAAAAARPSSLTINDCFSRWMK